MSARGGGEWPAYPRRMATRAPGAPPSAPRRTVHVGDGLAWLESQAPHLGERACVVTSAPDISELAEAFGGRAPSPRQYTAWLRRAAALVVSRLAPGTCAIFYQTDCRVDDGHGGWEYIDKSFACSLGAVEDAGGATLWHKVALRAPPDKATMGVNPGYTHVLCFGAPGGTRCPSTARAKEELGCAPVPDVLTRGEVQWARGTGVVVAERAARWCRDALGARHVVDPFCGTGATLAAANMAGLEVCALMFGRALPPATSLTPLPSAAGNGRGAEPQARADGAAASGAAGAQRRRRARAARPAARSGRQHRGAKASCA